MFCKEFYDTFNLHKEDILDVLIEHYHENNRDKIIKRFNKTDFVFESNPVDEYNYMLFNDYSFRDLIKSLKEILIFERNSKKYKKEYYKWLEIYINTKLLQKGEIKLSNDNVWKIFSDYIFAFSIDSEILLNNESTPSSVKQNILDRKKCFYETVKKENLCIAVECDRVEEYCSFVNDVKDYFMCEIAKKTKLGNYLHNKYKSLFDINIKELVFGSTKAFNLTFFYDDNDKSKFYKILKYPIMSLKNNKSNNLDVTLMHEIIHSIETSEKGLGVGVDNNSKNIIFNEIRTQKLAIELTKKLHKKNIFIFDDPKNYEDEFMDSYEIYAPISFDFITKYDEIITDCAINNTPDKLEEIFGENFKEYSKLLDELHSKIKQYNECGYSNKNVTNEKALILVNKMNKYYEKKR